MKFLMQSITTLLNTSKKNLFNQFYLPLNSIIFMKYILSMKNTIITYFKISQIKNNKISYSIFQIKKQQVPLKSAMNTSNMLVTKYKHSLKNSLINAFNFKKFL